MLRLVNPTDKVVHLKPNKILACAYEIGDNGIFSLEHTDGLSSQGVKHSTPTGEPKSKRDTFVFNLDDSDLDATQKSQLLDFLQENSDVFSKWLQDLGCTHLQTHKIETGDAPPVWLPPYKQNPQMRLITSNMVKDMHENGVIDRSNSNWHSPVVLVKKANCDEYRFAIDYRKLNKISKPQAYPLPRLSDIFYAIGEANAKYFTSLDLAGTFE